MHGATQYVLSTTGPGLVLDLATAPNAFPGECSHPACCGTPYSSAPSYSSVMPFYCVRAWRVALHAAAVDLSGANLSPIPPACLSRTLPPPPVCAPTMCRPSPIPLCVLLGLCGSTGVLDPCLPGGSEMQYLIMTTDISPPQIAAAEPTFKCNTGANCKPLTCLMASLACNTPVRLAAMAAGV